jgi:hypothetical protein
MFLPNTSQLSIRGVADRGVPNRERIILYNFAAVNLQNFIMGIGHTTDDQLVTPFFGYVYYFDDIVIPAKSWVIVYTGPGQHQVSKLPPNDEIAFIYHWGLNSVLFQQREVVPILFRISEMNFPLREQPALAGPSRVQAALANQ